MAKVTAKNNLSGLVLGVRFRNGVAETDAPVALAFFRKNPDRFTVTEQADKPGSHVATIPADDADEPTDD